jgi:hypothetical protein
MKHNEELKIGRIYFGIAYEDDALKYPIIHSYEYLGLSDEQPEVHAFRFLGSGDSLELTDGQLDLIFGPNELMRSLQRWARENPTLSPD